MLVLALAPSVSAQAPPAVAFMPVGPPSHLAVGHQYYDADLDGLRAYLESIRQDQPAAYASLDPELSSLESQATLGIAIGLGSLAAGGGLMLYAVERSQACRLRFPSVEQQDELDACQDRDHPLVLLGAGVAMVGGIAGFLLVPPGRSDLLTFVNRHNHVNPDHPMRMNVGFDPHRRSAHLALRLDFDLPAF